MIRFTQHAVDRFVEHWRPGMSCEQAEGTLRRLIASAARTKINARGGDARIHVAETERGERILLVVRGGWVVTVLPRRSWEDDALAARTRRQDGGRGESAHPIVEPRAALMASLFEDSTAARREKAEAILASFRAGAPVGRKTLRRVAEVLGLSMAQIARDPFDTLVSDASRGDRRAIGALAIGYGPTLLAQAREALCEERQQEDADVLQELFLEMTRGAHPFEPGGQRAVEWLRGRVQCLAGGVSRCDAHVVGEVGAPERSVA
jgi:hypothetical protein